MTRLFTRVRQDSTVRMCLTLRMIPRRWLTLVKSASIWSDYDNVWFKVIPRYLNDSTRFSGLLLIRRFIFCSLALLPKNINLHLEVLRVKRLAPNQRDKFCRSADLNSAEFSFCSNTIVVLAEQNRTISSAYREMSQFLTVEGISFA
jgi:hypothetical protein